MAYETLTAMFSDIAGAIREKESSSGSIPAADFAGRIRSLTVGDGDAPITYIGDIHAVDISTKPDGTKSLEIAALIKIAYWDLFGIFNEIGIHPNVDGITATPVDHGWHVTGGTITVDRNVPVMDHYLLLGEEEWSYVSARHVQLLGNYIEVGSSMRGSAANNIPFPAPGTDLDLLGFLRTYWSASSIVDRPLDNADDTASRWCSNYDGIYVTAAIGDHRYCTIDLKWG